MDFKGIFEAYGGDYEATMARFMGKEDLYKKLLGMLFQDVNMKKLEAALGENDLAGAFDAAHAIKGVSGNLGLAPLYAAVCTIIEPLRHREAREDYPEMLEAVKREYQRAEVLHRDLVAL